MQWKPIETAPQDGAVIDLWVTHPDGSGERVPDAFWSDKGLDYGPARCDNSPGWVAANMGYDGGEGYADHPEDGIIATHWMPVPEAPKEEKYAK